MATYIDRESSGGPLAIILMIVVLAAAAFGVYYFMDRDATPATDTTIIESPAVTPMNDAVDTDFDAPALDTAPDAVDTTDTTTDNM